MRCDWVRCGGVRCSMAPVTTVVSDAWLCFMMPILGGRIYALDQNDKVIAKK